MKEIKKLVEKERQEILKDDNFLEENLYPLVTAKPKVNLKKLSLIITPVLVLIISFSFLFAFYFNNNSGYSNKTAMKISNAICLNECLEKTQIKGEFKSIILTYNIKSNKPIFFMLSHELRTDEILMDSEFDVIVDKNYKPLVDDITYKNSFEFLNYNVLFTENTKESIYEGMTVYEYSICALLDTNEERYFIKYNEISANKTSFFKNHLEKLIYNKI